ERRDGVVVPLGMREGHGLVHDLEHGRRICLHGAVLPGRARAGTRGYITRLGDGARGPAHLGWLWGAGKEAQMDPVAREEIRHPIAGVAAAAILIALWLITVGVVRLVTAFEIPDNRVIGVIVALLEIAAGVVIVASPDIGFATLAILAGIAFIVNGVGVFAL